MPNTDFNIPKGKFSFRPPSQTELAWLERKNRRTFPSWTATLFAGPALVGVLATINGCVAG